MTAFSSYVSLVRRLSTSEINRSENDLSSSLKTALETFGLHAVFDTGGGDNRRIRPDVSLYTELFAADLGAAAEVVIEAKRPAELNGYASLAAALVSDWLWIEKFVPYVRAHAERVRFFLLTTFEQVLVVPIFDETRRIVSSEDEITPDRRAQVLEQARTFDLRQDSSAFEAWCQAHLSPGFLRPLPFSSLLNLRALRDSDDLEQFATELAEVVAGSQAAAPSAEGSALLAMVAAAGSLDELPPSVRRALIIYTMATNGGLSLETAERYLRSHFRQELGEFVGASVHSLVSRLFAIKVLEDAFCVGVNPPLVPLNLWIFNSSRFDSVSSERLPQDVLEALNEFGEQAPPAIRDFATSGKFYDWIQSYLDPATFRRLVELFFMHEFTQLDGDLLGRFFELYAQRVDRRRRRALGQYYTPLPIVRFLWRRAMEIVAEQDAAADLIVLDPSVGSGTFLSEGVGYLQAAGLDRFWERLFGFDISPQVIGIAQVNLYLSVLGALTRSAADQVASLGLYPTDTLDPTGGQRLQAMMALLADEAVLTFIQNRIELSEHVKRRNHFPLVIGNPPYRHNPDRTLSQVADVFPTLLRSSRENARAQENTIREDYAWFFAAADYYTTNRGIIAFVVSDSFCYARSFRFFRPDLLRRYRVRYLVRLGRFVFRDVGPRISFVLVVLQRRVDELPDPTQTEPIAVADLRSLAEGHTADLGREADPRFIALTADALRFTEHIPSRQRDFAFFPAGEAARVVLRFPVKLIDAPRRVFTKKWPGAVSGFDKVFKSRDRATLEDRIRRLFAAACADEADQSATVATTAAECRLDSDEVEKLRTVLTIIRDGRLTFATTNVRRALTGSAPNECAWYPDARMTAWIYYEPRITFERAVHEGRDPGWGTSNQWREAESHSVTPKLVFTTSTNPDRGLKAFVLTDDWIVLKAAGTRQQLNYTGVDNPLRPLQLEPNNLGGEALQLYNAMARIGADGEDFLLYTAGLYNSVLAEEFVAEGGDSALRIPLDPAAAEDAIHIARISRRIRDLRRAVAALDTVAEDQSALEPFSSEDLIEFGFVRVEYGGGRFQTESRWEPADEVVEALQQSIQALQVELNPAVEALFSSYDR